MFTIGLFSTYLPYLLVAMFYGAYIGINTLMKEEPGTEDDPRLAARQIMKKDAGEPSHSEKETFHYDNYTSDTETCAECPVFRVVQLRCPDPDPDISQPWFFSNLFCRPPPPLA
jgi:hypothetical protein